MMSGERLRTGGVGAEAGMARGLAGRREGTGWGRGGRWSSAVRKARPSSRGVPLVRTLPASGPSQRVLRALLCQRRVPGRSVPRSGLRVPPIAGVVSQRHGAGAGAAMGGPRWRLVKGSPTLGQGKRPRLRVPLAGTRRQAWLPAFLALGPVGASVSKPRLEKDSQSSAQPTWLGASRRHRASLCAVGTACGQPPCPPPPPHLCQLPPGPQA